MQDEYGGGYFSASSTRYNFPLYNQFVNAHGRKLYLGESNSVSCGGASGISDVFGAAIWSIDWYEEGEEEAE
jgi:hypothetical protein